MSWRLPGVLFGLVLALAVPRVSLAETVMEKISRTGVLSVGTRVDVVPYAYVNDQEKLVGYSIDAINRIKDELQKRLGREITIEIVEQPTVSERIPQLISGNIDIACDTAFTWERDQFVDFSLSYGLSGIRLVTKTGSGLGTPESLVGKRIGTLSNSVAAQAIKLIQPQANIIDLTGDPEAALAKLKAGEIDAIAGDTVILGGLAAKMDPTGLQIVPKDPYARYGVACMIPENNSTFLNVVNFALGNMMQNYVIGDAQTVSQMGQWFGPEGIVDIDPQLLKDYFQMILISREQVPPTAPLPTSK